MMASIIVDETPKHFAFRVTPEVVRAFQHAEVSGAQRFTEGQIARAHKRAKIERHTRFEAGDTFCPMGSFSYSRSAVPSFMVIGRYCSIAKGLSVFGAAHPTDRLTTSPFTYNSRHFARIRKEFPGAMFFEGIPPPKKSNRITIGNDVWIGQGVTLARGITIGDGAVIAAGAVVTKDVPPMEIWGGVPGRLIRPRHPVEIANRILQTRWWRFAYPVLPSMSEGELITGYLNRLEAAIPSLAPYQPKPFVPYDIILALQSNGQWRTDSEPQP